MNNDAFKELYVAMGLRIEERDRLRSLLSRAAGYLDQLEDQGPADSGWKSTELTSLLAEIESELEG